MESVANLGGIAEKKPLSRRRTMKNLCLLAFLAVLALAARPQEAAPDGFKLWSPASLAPIVQSLGTKAATDSHHASTERLADFDHEYFLLAHREGDGQAEWHETEVDVFLVQSGSATLIVGGTMPDAQTISPHEKRGNSIQGGTRQKLSAGDIVRIPARTPHQLLLDGAHDFTYFVVKVKGY
jgi:mannose-6-phosphate isomerase-like protein (cupin superfamily)